LLSDRKRLILKAVIENYSEKNQPIGSKLLTSLNYLRFSSATIRYDMVQLEKEGYLVKNHKSSGRIPSLKGYIFYLKHLMTRKSGTLKMISLFEKIINKKTLNKDKIIKEVLKLLCNLTNYVTLNIEPDIFKTSKISKINLIFLSLEQAIILVITNKGHLRHQNIFFTKEESLEHEKLNKIIKILDNLLFNKYLFEALNLIQSEVIKNKIKKYCFQYTEKLIKFLNETFCNFMKNNSYIYGLSNFFNNQNSKNLQTIQEVIKILDNKELNKIFSDSNDLVYRLVNQVTLLPYKKFVIISIPYNINENEKGFIGILGPLIMKYHEIIPILEYLSAHLSQLYENKQYSNKKNLNL
jgi:heat-inducible transcriptional repressor